MGTKGQEGFLKDRVWMLLRRYPDGLTVREISDLIDAEIKEVRRALTKVQVAYIHHWVDKEGHPSTSVWRVVEVPPNAPRPAPLPASVDRLAAKRKRILKLEPQPTPERVIDEAKKLERDIKRMEIAQAYEAKRTARRREKRQAERELKEMIRRMTNVATLQEREPNTPSGLTTIRGPWYPILTTRIK